ncbi:MAG: T9SS type A sorting domain-containing protein, partial [Fidelibacterota bacterium]
EALKMAEFDPVVKFNHCTLDSVSNSDYRMIDVRSGTAEVKNSIFTHGIHAEAVQLLGAASTISYIDTFMVGDLDVPTIGTGILGVDPLYNDPANGDYRLAAASPVRGAADDGSAMGDLRWEALPSQYYLTIITEGNGIVELDPPGGVYDASTVVTLTAVPDPFWGLESWTGNVSPALPPDANPVTVTMNANETVTATFVNLKPKYLLSIDVVGVGHVEKSPEPLEGGVYEEGTEVTLEAVSDSITWAFTGWSGDTVSTVNPITVTVDSAISITASFASTLTQCTLSVDIAGMGEVDFDPEPLLGSYDTNTVVILTATAALGYEFSSWSGDFVSTENPDTFAVDSNMVVTATFNEVSVTSGIMAVDDSWDLRDALEFANNHSVVDTLLLTTSGGLYTSTNTSDVKVTAPLVIMAADTLAEKPICTNSDVEGSNDDIFRVFDDFTLIGVVLDGGHDQTHGPKYGIRLRDYSDREVKHGTDVTVLDCDFIDFFEDKVLTKDGHGFKIDVNIVAGGVKFENCTFTNFGYEAIRVSDTEKWVTERALDSLIVRNCTFTNIDAEGIRYYSDVDPATADPPVIAEHLTFNNSATRTIYIKNSGGAIVRDIIIANSRISGHGRDADLLDGQGNTGVPSYVSHIDTFNVLAVPIKSTDGEVDTTTIFGFDPMFEDAANLNYTLLSGSPAYGKAHDGEALGDLRWATNPPPAAVDDNLIVPAEYSLSQNYPNPFNPSTTIRFALKHPGKTTLVVYDLLGREILRLIDGEMEVGYHEVVLSERTIASGIYIYQLRSGEFVMAKKMILLK